ncbi:MAG: amidase [Rhodospirillales bacterium]
MNHTAETSLAGLGLAEAARDAAAGTVSAEGLVRDCLARVDAHDSDIHAWAHLDAEAALSQARARDEARARGEPCGRLHGVPIGVKDIIDAAFMPAERGSPLHKGRIAREDAEAVRRLRAAGAVIMGKTVTAELAVLHPNETRNPHDPARTPGGSSSGSAAAVAAFMVPGALGTQTNGSVIRPAAHCGVVGYKPSFGLIPRTGILTNSRALDTVGVFARSVEDAALLAEVMTGAHEGDSDTRCVGVVPPLAAVAVSEPPARPRLVFAETPVWDRTAPETREAFAELQGALSEYLIETPMPADCGLAYDQLGVVMNADLAHALRRDYETRPDGLSETLRSLIERGRGVLAMDYARALDFKAALADAMDEVFDDADAIITPAAAGEAPLDHTKGTGDPAFCTLWQFCGMPAVSLPLLTGPNGLPMGVQVVGRRGDDARLLRTAHWMMQTLQAGA